jgi:transcriptional regulator with XRE-family HTH domain
MATREYPNEWARLIADIVARPGWTKARLAREAELGKNTPDRWISGETANITTEKVRAVADAADIDYNVAAQAAIGAQAQQKAEDDRAVRMILDSDASDEAKNDLIAHIRGRRREARDAEIRDVEFWLRTHRPQPEG